MLVSKKKRIDIIEECLYGENPYQGKIDDLPDYLVKEYKLKKYSVITIKRDIKEVKERHEALEHNSDEPSYTVSELIKMEITELFKYDSPRIQTLITTGERINTSKKTSSKETTPKTVHTIFFSTQKNTAPVLAKLLDKLYGTKILGTTYGDNLVILYTNSAGNAEKYYKQLKKLRPKPSTAESDSEE